MVLPLPRIRSTARSLRRLGFSPCILCLLSYFLRGLRRHLIDEGVHELHEPAVRLGRPLVGGRLVAGHVSLVEFRVLPVLEMVERAASFRSGQHAESPSRHPLGRVHGLQPPTADASKFRSHPRQLGEENFDASAVRL